MAADAEGEGVVLDWLAGEGIGRHSPPLQLIILVIEAAGGVHPDVQPPLPVFCHAHLHRFQQQRLASLGPPHLGEGVQLLPLDGQQGLDPQHRPHSRHSRGDPPALAQVLQGVHADIDQRVPAGLLQPRLDLRRPCAGIRQGAGIPHSVLLGYGDLVVIRHLHPPAVIRRQDQRRLAGAAQAAGHGDIHNLVMPLRQDAVPQAGQVVRRGLGGGHAAPLPQVPVELLREQVYALVVNLVVNDNGHRHHLDIHALRFFPGNPAVAVCYNRYFTHI